MRGRNVPRWVTTIVLAMSGTIAALLFTLTIPLLPVLPDILSVTPNDSSWVVTITLLTSAVVTPILSRMADMYGKRRIIVIALIAITIGSAVVAIGGSYPTMLVGRALQGFGQSLIPVAISLLRDLLPKERVGSAVALMSATLGIGAGLGLPLSGFLYEHFGWQSVFWFPAIGAGLFVFVVLLVVDESPLRAPARFDVAGALMLSIILTSVLLVITKSGQWGGAVIWVLLGVAALGLSAWIPMQLRTGNPMVDLRTLSRRPVLLTNVSTLLSTAPNFANMLVTIQQLQAPTASGYGFGLSIAEAGIVMLPVGLVMVAITPLSGALLNRWGGRGVLILGNGVMAVAFVLRIFLADSVLLVIVVATIASAGAALAFAAMPTLIMASVPLTETASANGINALARSLAMALCSAFIALLVSTMAVTISGHDYLSAWALQLCFWFAAAAAVVAAAVAAFIPVRAAATSTAHLAEGETGSETLIRGRVVLGGHVVSRHPATITFMTPDGTPVDWSRADLDGRYSAVLPGPGRYIAVANAAGWAPETHVLEVSGSEIERDLGVSERLELIGRVSAGGSPVPGALVVLHRSEGAFVTSVVADERADYRLPLPLAGPYVVTAIDPRSAWAHSHKLMIGVQSTRLDLTGDA
jgi:MFS family permease